MDAKSFERIRKSGKVTRTRCLKLSVLAGNRKRLGVVVSRRVGNAVERNRLKRVVREHFRLHCELYPQGDCVVIPNPLAATSPNNELRSELERALAKAKQTT